MRSVSREQRRKNFEERVRGQPGVRCSVTIYLRHTEYTVSNKVAPKGMQAVKFHNHSLVLVDLYQVGR